ncbi:MAG: 4Fe-4S cluster-binding domain-containing protein, partial [Lachnospiraceae bacterium]
MISIKKVIKILLSPVIKLADLFCNPIHTHLWRMEENLRKIHKDSDALLSESLMKISDSIESDNNQYKDVKKEFIQLIDSNIKESEKNILQTFDGRIWKAEENIMKTVDGRIWMSEENIVNSLLTAVLKIQPRLRLNRFYVHLVEHCNLNCQCCDNFSPIAEEKFVDYDALDLDFSRMAELSGGDIGTIELAGGEPLLHPKICEFVQMTRKYFKNTEIWIVTNGILLSNMQDAFWQCCAQYKAKIVITKYPININVPSIEEKTLKFGVDWRYYDESEKTVKTSYYIPFTLTPAGGGGNVSEKNFCTVFTPTIAFVFPMVG